MTNPVLNSAKLVACSATLALAVGLAGANGAAAGEAEAKALLKGMSDYLAAQKTISFSYDTSFEVVSKDKQKLQVAASGNINMSRPEKLRASRSGGSANVEMVFDGKTFTILGKDLNIYAQAEVPGTIDNLVDEVRDKFHKPVPGADLLVANVYDELMRDVVDVKDLGSGFIGGRECDHLAFRAKELDFQIWIAQGDRPYPCRYVITATQVDQSPQYSVDIRDWKTGDEVAQDDFSFKAPDSAKMLDPKELKAMKRLSDIPSNFSIGDAQ